MASLATACLVKKQSSPPGRVLCSWDVGSFLPSSEASSRKHWQKQDPGPQRQPALPHGAGLSFPLTNTSKPLWAVKCEVRLLLSTTADTTALNVIWWGALPELMFPQLREKILHSAGKVFFRGPGAVVSPCSASLQLRDALLKGLKAKANIKLQRVFQNEVKIRQPPSCTTEEQSTRTAPGAVGLLFLLGEHRCLLSLGGGRNRNIIHTRERPP